MRWPTIPSPDGKGDLIDQDAVNELVDYAIAHGVNYFDTSPVYVQGWSERLRGLPLVGIPGTRIIWLPNCRISRTIRVKTRWRCTAVHSASCKPIIWIIICSTPSVVARGMKTFNDRYVDNGMLDFLMKEREAGRIRHLGWSFHGTSDVFDEVLAMHDTVHWDFVQIQLNYVDWRHATGRNVNAEYLYQELEKRNVPAIIMEPLLGGRLSNVPQHIVTRLKQRRPEDSVASWAFRFAGSPELVLTALSGMTYMEHLQDNIRTYSPAYSADR